LSNPQRITTLYKAWLFVKRGWLTTMTYRVALGLSLISGFISIIQFGLMANFLSEGNHFALLEPYGGNLLAYLVIGSAFTGFVGVSLNSFRTAIQSEQQMGTLEHLLLNATPLGLMLLYASLWGFLNTLLNTVILFVVVMVILKVSLLINWLASTVVLALTILSLSGIGLLSAGCVMISKQGDPVGWAFTTLSGLLSGVMFPVEYLPPALQSLAYLLPTTHALKALRLALIRGSGLADMLPEITFLLLSACLTIPLGLWFFRRSFDHARREGTLAEF
jgi:ABC-2 type transport system permease protein